MDLRGFFLLNIFAMAKDKKSFILYSDAIHTVEKLSDTDAGQLLKHLLRYVNDQNPTTDNPLVEIAFEPIKQQLKRDLVKFEDVKVKRSEAGKAGATKRWQDIANANKGIQTIANIAVNDNDNVNVISKDIYRSFAHLSISNAGSSSIYITTSSLTFVSMCRHRSPQPHTITGWSMRRKRKKVGKMKHGHFARAR